VLGDEIDNARILSTDLDPEPGGSPRARRNGISCGRGRDRALVDRTFLVEGGCERLRRRGR
jgi:hypothetical protein